MRIRSLKLNAARFLTVTIVAGQPNIVLVGTATFRNRNYMIEFNFVVAKVSAAFLTSVVIPANDAHLNLKRNVAAAS